ncbi:MAG: hypothetical protein ABIW33_00005, partial [Sphingomicrobium sp.]
MRKYVARLRMVRGNDAAHGGTRATDPQLKRMTLAFASGRDWLKSHVRLPSTVPAFGSRTHRVFSIFWIAAFLLALAGPIIGIYLRYSAPENNSQLLLGSRAGFAVSL